MAIKLSKEVEKNIEKLNYFSIESFINSGKAFLKATEQGRMICNIESISKSGMSRTLKFVSCEGKGKNFNYRNYFAMFKALGFNEVKNSGGYFRINGCGMDMVFATNYQVVRQLQQMGFTTKEKSKWLEQKTPTTI